MRKLFLPQMLDGQFYQFRIPPKLGMGDLYYEYSYSDFHHYLNIALSDENDHSVVLLSG